MRTPIGAEAMTSRVTFRMEPSFKDRLEDAAGAQGIGKYLRRLAETDMERNHRYDNLLGQRRPASEPAPIKDAVADVMATVPGLVPASSLKTRPPAGGDAQDQTITDEPRPRVEKPWND